METTPYEAGRLARKGWVKSPVWRQFDPNTPGELAMKLFLPPVPQDLMQVARPLPRSHAEWLRGWNDEKATE